jgi:thiosulfate/3-mercaptopyruvate sulfurtransferase
MKVRVVLWSAAVLSVTITARSRGDEPPAKVSPPPLVTQEVIQKRLAEPALRLIDARPRADYDGGHIPGAVWLDPKVFDPLTRGNAATDRARWGRVLAPLGVGPDTEILVYDDDRYHLQAGRVWFWLSYAADARAIGLVDGGFLSWKRAGRPVSTDEKHVEAGEAVVTFRPELLATRQDVQTATLRQTSQLVDARTEDEYVGKGVCPISKKPLPGGRAGHLPSAKLLEAGKVVREDGTFLEPAALRALLSQAGIETDRPTILYSKGGARSNATVFALRRLGVPVRHYVAGLNEWALDPTLPLVTTSESLGAN